MITNYLLLGFFWHDEEELKLRKEAIYDRHHNIEESTTMIFGDIRSGVKKDLTGIISTHLSFDISHDETFGTVELSLEKKLPLFFGTKYALKNYTQIYLVHNIGKTGKVQLISGRKKGIGGTLDGTYIGFCCDINMPYSEFISSYNKDANSSIKYILSTNPLESRRYAKFELRLLDERVDSDDGDDHDSKDLPNPVPIIKEPKLTPELA